MEDIWKPICDPKGEILEIEPRIDLLHDVLGFGRFAEITETSDRFFLGRKPGDIGFNEFLGRPSDAAKRRTRELFQKLSECSQQQVLSVLRGKEINPRDLGIER